MRVCERGTEVQDVSHVTLEDAQVLHATAERLSGAKTVLLHLSCDTHTHTHRQQLLGPYHRYMIDSLLGESI